MLLMPRHQSFPIKPNRHPFHSLLRFQPHHLLPLQPIEHGDQHIGGGIDLNRVEFTGRRAILENIIDGRFEPFSGLSLYRYTCAVPIGRTHRAGP
jgi:hypothetical protein